MNTEVVIRQNQCKDEFSVISKVIWQTKGSLWRNALLLAFRYSTQPLLQLTKGNAFQIICKKHVLLLLSNCDTLSNLHLWVFMCIINTEKMHVVPKICSLFAQSTMHTVTAPPTHYKNISACTGQPSACTLTAHAPQEPEVCRPVGGQGSSRKGWGGGGSSHTAWQLTVHDSNNRHTCKMLVTFKFTCLAPQRSNSQGA